jgi:LysR family glycine cleavage system transcriptional activator
MQPIYPKSFLQDYDFSNPEQPPNVPLVHTDSTPESWHRWSQASGLPIPNPDREYHFSDYPATIEAAKSLGGAIAVMPIEKQLLQRKLVVAPFPPWGPVEEKVYAVYRPADNNNPAIASFIEWIKNLLKELESD